jgi:hypothetical protein
LDKDEFVRMCQLCGYASKKNAKKYAENKETLTDADFKEVFRINERKNDIGHGVLSMKCKSDGDELIRQLGKNPKPWNRIFDASRGIKDGNK